MMHVGLHCMRLKGSIIIYSSRHVTVEHMQ